MGAVSVLAVLKVISLILFKIKTDRTVKIVPQADSEMSTGKVMTAGDTASSTGQEQNVRFDDAHGGFVETRGVTTDPLRSTMNDPMTSLQNFFLRPIKIHEFDWVIKSGPSTTFNPWQMYFEDRRVINRVSNYKLMKASLRVKFVVNGNSFYYGRVMVSYRPLHTLDNTTVLIPNNFDDLVEASQRPHVWLNPTISQGGEMVLPFFTPYNMLDIPSQQWRDMGLLEVNTPSPLEHANGATLPVTVSVFAWCENIEFSGITQQNPTNIVPQAATEYKGIVSKPASVVAKTASLFKSVPSISGFATATEIGAKSIATLAALFGYSKPVAEDIPPLQPVSRQSMACCDGRESLIKLTVDPCQELSIDPAIASLDIPDELTINSISNRETLLTKFDWATGMATEALLFNIIVDPCVIRQSSTGDNADMHFPAMAFATFPFEYWKGTLRYRFQIVASGFHKGRMKIVYDPYGTPAEGKAEYNTAYTEIVDISECNDFCIDVGWGQHTPWRHHLNFPQLPNSSFSGANVTSPAQPLGLTSDNLIGVGNGTLSVYIVNELTVPDSTIPNDIEILVSVSACDDFEVAAPTDYYLSRLAVTPVTTPPANVNIVPHGASEESMMNLDTPVSDPQCNMYMGTKPVLDPVVNRIHMGETVLSFRQLLKRYNLHEALQPLIGDTSAGIVLFQRRMFPYFGGYITDPDASNQLIHNTTTGAYVYANLTLMNYLVRAYGAWRGGIRYTIDATFNEMMTSAATPIGSTHYSTWEFHRQGNIAEREYTESVDNDITPPIYFGDSQTPQYSQYAGIKTNSLGLAGASRWTTAVNPIHSFEVPYYSKYRFCPGRRGTLWRDKDVFQDSFVLACTTLGTTGVEVAYSYVAAAEDFTMMFYLSPPRFYSQSVPEPDTIV